MDITKIYTFGDGYASNHIWPEWPWLLELLFPDIKFEHHGAIGAGNEFITNAVIQAHLADPNAYFIVQWAEPHRFDKLLQDSSWNSVIDNDPDYSTNKVNSFGKTWWLSSKSKQVEIQKYHGKFVQSNQHRLRSANFIYLVDQLLRGKCLFFSTAPTKHLLHSATLNNYVEQDMLTYSQAERFKGIRQNEIQPSPVVHLEYVKQHILPNIPLTPDWARLLKLSELINQQAWIPYDPDRAEIWNSIKSQL